MLILPQVKSFVNSFCALFLKKTGQTQKAYKLQRKPNKINEPKSITVDSPTWAFQ